MSCASVLAYPRVSAGSVECKMITRCAPSSCVNIDMSAVPSLGEERHGGTKTYDDILEDLFVKQHVQGKEHESRYPGWGRAGNGGQASVEQHKAVRKRHLVTGRRPQDMKYREWQEYKYWDGHGVASHTRIDSSFSPPAEISPPLSTLVPSCITEID